MSVWTQEAGPSKARRRIALLALCVALPILSLGYQIAAKETAMTMAATPFGVGWFAEVVRQPSTWLLLALEAASFLAWMTALSEMKLSAAFPMSALSYVMIIATGWLVYGEPANWGQAVGGALILAGIWQIGRGTDEP